MKLKNMMMCTLYTISRAHHPHRIHQTGTWVSAQACLSSTSGVHPWVPRTLCCHFCPCQKDWRNAPRKKTEKFQVLSTISLMFRRKRLLKSSSWPSTSYLGHLPLFVVPQRMLLKLREDNSKFLPARSSLCYVGILKHFPLWLKPPPTPSPIDNREGVWFQSHLEIYLTLMYYIYL